MRIIAGKYKGKVLKEFDLGTTRPTADMVREALFDKIGIDIAGKTFLDLFAGTGAVGLEAASRNASFCTFVDAEKKSTEIIKKNIELLNAQNIEVLCMDFAKALEYFASHGKRFDYIFLDPPYKTDFAERAIDIIRQLQLLSPDGLLIWEHDKSKAAYVEKQFPDCKTKKYGIKFLTYIYNKK